MVQSLSTEFDVAVIGAGVVGCAVARRFALAGAKVVVIEKGADILSGASKANSAILHTGFDAPEGSLELELVKAGRAEYLSIHGEMGLSLVETGALVCAWNPDEAERLSAIAEQGRRNGIVELDLLTARQARETMPGLSSHLVAALEVSGEHIIDPWSAPLGYLTQAVGLGAQLVRNAEVLSGSFDGAWRIETTAGPILAASVVNAAGLFGDIVDTRLGLLPEFTIMPRKGQFVVLDKAARRHVPCIVLPVPTEITKGIVVCPTAFGNVLIGPTAEEQDDRERATVETATLQALLKRGAEIVPELASISVTAVYAGLRPASDKKHYRISARPDRRAITLGGVRSTGLSAALGLAQHALTLHAGFGTCFDLPSSVPEVTMPNLTETCERDWQRADHGEIVCHCELVTRREIDATFSSPVPPGDFGGLRRRTRAGMGRCQGFYCNARLAAMTGDRLAVPLAVSVGDER
ncbi:NAD(P)/FAD-dependent oxidoreductase [Agrobacterium sp. O3.4]|uniref:NAD(P)/FAD-dependent oxidoreductase n=1 Tax=Agrobacterium cucumeris TaxID=2862866 RepID=A0ABY8RJ82_9HYPH|nr:MULTISPECIES: NAD(P)/FAD-dependent oxidoreductase [Rhizobium/Agrobacterium group]MCZ7472114.1 NAD(P)/FAD-dependent oxidoreductase [Rhizobium rhizogenes]WHO07641.1 NAD(P)/FAD-dependent oxidoreductase [Agrobacterium cucumeris]